MKIIDDRTVELTDAELVVKDWHDSLVDRGLGLSSAVIYIKDSVPATSLAWRLVDYMEPYLVEGAHAMPADAEVPSV